MAAVTHLGFEAPVEAAQRHFRALLAAMSEPGRIVTLESELPTPPAPLAPAAYALALSLFDFETPVWLDPAMATPAVAHSLRFHCGCPIVGSPGEAAFALVADPAGLPPLASFAQGTPEYPDRSTTLILQVASLAAGIPGLRLAGPGIASVAHLRVEGLPAAFWDQVRANRKRFPLGVDLILVERDRAAALPRSTAVEGN